MRAGGNTPRVLMVLRQGRRISTYPSVVNAARVWQRSGADVHIVTGAEPDVPGLFGEFFRWRRSSFLGQTASVRKILLRGRYDVVIAYEPIDAEMLALAAAGVSARYVYHNIELRYAAGWKFAVHNRLERAYFDRCDLVICQDPIRLGELGRLLGRATAGAGKRFACVPNTYLPGDAPADPRFLQKALGIPGDSKILLYSGSIQRKKVPREMITHLLGVLPPAWRLVLSGWSVDGCAEELAGEIGPGRRFHVYLETLGEQDYIDLIASATAGLVWYQGTDDPNEHCIGLSSGKFWRFVTLGKRTIVPDLPGLGDFVRERDLGIVVTDLSFLRAESFGSLEAPVVPRDDYFFDRPYGEAIRPALSSFR